MAIKANKKKSNIGGSIAGSNSIVSKKTDEDEEYDLEMEAARMAYLEKLQEQRSKDARGDNEETKTDEEDEDNQSNRGSDNEEHKLDANDRKEYIQQNINSKSNGSNSIYNTRGLMTKIKELQDLYADRPWPETLDVCEFPLDLDDHQDDLKREAAFYSMTLNGLRSARDKLKDYDIKYERPEDYFCDMLKSDDQMMRIKDRLIFEQKKIAAVEARKQQQGNKKYAKALQAERKDAKAKEKKELGKEIDKWRKSNKNGNNRAGSLLKDDDGLDRIISGAGKKSLKEKKLTPNKRRQYFNEKYGHGGIPSWKRKRNDEKSINDMSSFNPKKGKLIGGKKGKKGKVQRPGKSAREHARNQRKKQK